MKWFNVSKGYGFLSLDAAVDGGENDDGKRSQSRVREPLHHPVFVSVFVHQTAIQSGGFRFLREGERVEFELTETDRGVQASNVTGVGGVPLDRTRMEYGADSE